MKKSSDIRDVLNLPHFDGHFKQDTIDWKGVSNEKKETNSHVSLNWKQSGYWRKETNLQLSWQGS